MPDILPRRCEYTPDLLRQEAEKLYLALAKRAGEQPYVSNPYTGERLTDRVLVGATLFKLSYDHCFAWKYNPEITEPQTECARNDFVTNFPEFSDYSFFLAVLSFLSLNLNDIAESVSSWRRGDDVFEREAGGVRLDIRRELRSLICRFDEAELRTEAVIMYGEMFWALSKRRDMVRSGLFEDVVPKLSGVTGDGTSEVELNLRKDFPEDDPISAIAATVYLAEHFEEVACEAESSTIAVPLHYAQTFGFGEAAASDIAVGSSDVVFYNRPVDEDQ